MKHAQENTEALLILGTVLPIVCESTVKHIVGVRLRTGLGNLWHAERLPWHAAFTAVPIYFYLFCQTSVSIM
jgi:hypothetical protein